MLRTLALGLLGFGLSLDAAVFIKIGDIKGESTDKNHQEWIIVESFDDGGFSRRSQGGFAGFFARRRGDIKWNDFNFCRKIDRSSVAIAESAASGQVFDTVTLSITNSAADDAEGRERGPGNPYLVIKMKQVMISSYSLSADNQEGPAEDFTLNFEQIKMEYLPNDPKQGNEVSVGRNGVLEPRAVAKLSH